MEETERYLERLPLPLRVPARELAHVVREAVPEARERVKWGIPMWSVGGTDFCYLRHGDDHVSLGFQQGASLQDPCGLLVALGRAKGARNLLVRVGEPVPCRQAKDLVVQAARLARRG